MKLKFTLQRPGAEPVDLVATVDATTTLGELASYIVKSDPTNPQAAIPDDLTLGIVGAGYRGLPPRQSVVDSTLRSGASVMVSRASESVTGSHKTAAAVVTVLAGPDKGREFSLPRGSSVMGRERGCDVLLSDGMVSRQHARINVADTVEIIDLGSANGVVVDETPISRAVVQPDDVIRLGDTEVSVRLLYTPAGVPAEVATTEFVRSPRMDLEYKGKVFAVPEPPERPAPAKFPYIMLMAPLIMGAVMYKITENIMSILFVLMFPLMMVGQAAESMMSGRFGFKRGVADWKSDMAHLTVDMREEVERETEARRAAHPSTEECVAAVQGATPLMWTRRPNERGFGELRIGLGTLPSRNQIEYGNPTKSPHELIEELTAQTAPFTRVDNVPVVAPLFSSALGVAGPREAALHLTRALLVQAAALHSPAELIVCAFCSSESARDWSWLKWLPHSAAAQPPFPSRQLAATAPAAVALAGDLQDLIDTRRATRTDRQHLPAVLVLVEGDTPLDRSRLVRLAEEGPAVGVFVVWVAAEAKRLPAACRTFVEVSAEAPVARVSSIDFGATIEQVALETVDVATTDGFARRISAFVDSGARLDEEGELPRAVSGLALLGPQLAASHDAVIERWHETQSIVSGPHGVDARSMRAATLRAIIGYAATGPHTVDLRVDGPHALVGGTTGSGKSELLQSWILGMATAHSPHRVTFLLVDYKGGAAFADCVELPHTVGMVTDLSPHLVRRALTSLRAELTYREHILNEYDAKDLVTLERKAPDKAPPSLVIIVDEFAALVQEVPEFVDGVVDVAQRGRSLGLHLILATQRPAGVIRENLRANTNLRLALRMADESDSLDVLGSPQAASFDPAIPGRAISKTAPGRLVPFQTAYVGGWTMDEGAAAEISVEELVFGAGTPWAPPKSEDTGRRDPAQTDIKRLVRSVQSASQAAQIEPPRKPWLPELKATYDLGDRTQVPTERRDDVLVFGIRDAPQLQAQPTVAFYPDYDGSMVVYGTGGTGKSTFLRTLAIAAGFTVRGGPCHVYAIDFGSRGLAMLEDLPHVGSVILGSDHERISRLLTWLRALIDERAYRYHQASAGTITQYRERTGIKDEPRILLLVDGISAFRSAYESGDRVRWFEMFTTIAAEGRPVGVHVVFSAEQRAGMSTALASAVQRRVVLRMANADDYFVLGVPGDVLTRESPPGRALVDDGEVQIAVLGGSSDVARQAASIRGFAESMRRAGATVAPPILSLPERISAAELPVTIDGRPVLGIGANQMVPFTVDPTGSFIVTGPPGSGRSAALQTLATALHASQPDMQMYYFGLRRTSVSTLDLWTGAAVGQIEANDLATKVAADISTRAHGEARIALFIESVGDFANTASDPALQTLIKAAIAEDGFVVAEGEASTLSMSFGLLGLIKGNRAGLALQPDQNDGASIFRTSFPRLDRAGLPPGRGLLVNDGRTETVQIALPA